MNSTEQGIDRQRAAGLAVGTSIGDHAERSDEVAAHAREHNRREGECHEECQPQAPDRDDAHPARESAVSPCRSSVIADTSAGKKSTACGLIKIARAVRIADTSRAQCPGRASRIAIPAHNEQGRVPVALACDIDR